MRLVKPVANVARALAVAALLMSSTASAGSITMIIDGFVTGENHWMDPGGNVQPIDPINFADYGSAGDYWFAEFTFNNMAGIQTSLVSMTYQITAEITVFDSVTWTPTTAYSGGGVLRLTDGDFAGIPPQFFSFEQVFGDSGAPTQTGVDDFFAVEVRGAGANFLSGGDPVAQSVLDGLDTAMIVGNRYVEIGGFGLPEPAQWENNAVGVASTLLALPTPSITNPIPEPSAAFVFPIGLAVVGMAVSRLRRRIS